MTELKTIRKELIFPEENRPFAICHASNLCRLQNGSFLAAWFAGSREGADDVAIWLSENRGKGWSRPRLVAHDIERDCQG